MVFEDKYGHILVEEEVNELSLWEIEEKGIHVLNDLEV